MTRSLPIALVGSLVALRALTAHPDIPAPYPSHRQMRVVAESLPAQVGTLAPPLTATAWLNASSPVRFGDGHVYVLGFTAYWCEACPRTYSPLVMINQEYASRGVRVVMVTAFYGQDLDFIKEYVNHYHVTLPVAIDGVVNSDDWQSPNAQQFATPSMPWAIVIDAQGRIRLRVQGIDDSVPYLQTLHTMLDSLIPPGVRDSQQKPPNSP